MGDEKSNARGSKGNGTSPEAGNNIRTKSKGKGKQKGKEAKGEDEKCSALGLESGSVKSQTQKDGMSTLEEMGQEQDWAGLDEDWSKVEEEWAKQDKIEGKEAEGCPALAPESGPIVGRTQKAGMSAEEVGQEQEWKALEDEFSKLEERWMEEEDERELVVKGGRDTDGQGFIDDLFEGNESDYKLHADQEVAELEIIVNP